MMYLAGDYDAALDHLRNALAINPELWIIHTFLGRTYERKGMINEALKALQKAFDLSGGNTETVSLKGYIYARLGDRAGAEQTLRVLTELSSKKYVPPYNIAMVHAGLGEVETALGWLEKAYETRDVRLTFLAMETKWDFMRRHPQFQDLLQRLAMPQLPAPKPARRT